MATDAIQPDVDQFIRAQKLKLQEERNQLNGGGDQRTRAHWDRTGADNSYAEQAIKPPLAGKASKTSRFGGGNLQPPRPPPQIDFEAWETEFQTDKKKSYNDYLQNQQRPRLRKEATPPQSGMILGEFEEYKKKIDNERKKVYAGELKKQVQEQAVLKGLRDHPNKQYVFQPEQADAPSVNKIKEAEFDRMLGGKKRQRQQLQQAVPPSPEFSDPGMQAYADELRRDFNGPRIRDIPTRAEDIEQLQREQQRHDQLRRQLEESENLQRERNRQADNYPPPRQQDAYPSPRQAAPAPEHYNDQDYQESARQPEQQQPPKQRYSTKRDELTRDPQGNRLSIEKEPSNPGLPIGQFQYDEKRRAMEQDRNKEYNDMVAKQQKRTVRDPLNKNATIEREPSKPGLPIGQSNYDDKRRAMEEDRNREYNQLIGKGRPKQAWQWDIEKEGLSLPMSPHEDKRKKLAEEKRKEYNEMMNKKFAAGQKNRHGLEEGGAALPLGEDYKAKKHKLDLERRQEYQDLIKQKQPVPGPSNRPDYDSEEEEREKEAFSLYQRRQREKKVEELEQLREYEKLLKQKQERVRRQGPPVTDVPPLRQEEPKPSRRPETPGGLLNKLGRSQEAKASQLKEEQKREYHDMMAQQTKALLDVAKAFVDVLDSARTEQTESLIGLLQGITSLQASQEDGQPKRAVPPLQLEEKNEPRPQRRTTGGQENYSNAPLPGMGPEVDTQKRRNRNNEYNEYQRQNDGRNRRPPPGPRDKHGRLNQQQRYDPDDDDDGDDVDHYSKEEAYTSLPMPGLGVSGSAKRRQQAAERNQEYNEFVREKNNRNRGRGRNDVEPSETRRGWQTPNYDEILQQKRQEEANYRRQDPYDGGLGRRYASEGNIDQIGTSQRQLRELDREYQERKAKFREERTRLQKGVLDDKDWLARPNESTARDEEYEELDLGHRSDSELEENQRYLGRENKTRPKSDNITGRNNMPPPEGYAATLPIGQHETNSAKRRRQNKYGNDLQKQIADAQAGKLRQKRENMSVNASGWLDPEKTNARLGHLGNPQITPRNNRIRDPEVREYHSKIVAQGSPRRGNYGNDILEYGGSKAGTDRLGLGERGRPARRTRFDLGPSESVQLEADFDQSLLQPRRSTSLGLPPGLEYRPSFTEVDPVTGVPSTHVTAGSGMPNLDHVDDAYRYYGMRNPLEPEPSAFQTTAPVPSLQLHEDRGRRNLRVSIEEPPLSSRRDRSRERISPYQFGDSEEKTRARSDKELYRLALEEQRREKEERKRRQKEEQIRYDLKKEEEIREYNPFGKGGGGAPIRDTKGNAIADLRTMRNVNEAQLTGRDLSARDLSARESPSQLRDDLIQPPPLQKNALGESSHARGGHGVFGNPLTDADKIKGDNYREELKNQINEKRRLKQIEQEKERIEDQKEQRRVEEQLQRIKAEYEEEQRKKREKEEEGRKKQEELIRKNEEKRREAERLKREKAEQRQREREIEAENQNKPSTFRTDSPPVPAARSKAAPNDGVPKTDGDLRATSRNTNRSRTNSPPVPSQRRRDSIADQNPAPVSRADSSLVSDQLRAMRKLLESERKRVEEALEVQQREPEIFDPRLVRKPNPPKEIDVFERATHGNASLPQRTVDNANPIHAQAFQNFKNEAAVPPTDTAAVPATVPEISAKFPAGDTVSRQAIRAAYPEFPSSHDALEVQQDATLRQQKENLRKLKERIWFPEPTPQPADVLIIDRGHVPPDDLGARQGTGTPKSLLKSNTAFIDVDIDGFPDDFEDMPRKNDSERYRRRDRFTPQLDGPSVMGSVTSLDVDKLQRKNDARLRRLHQLNADEISMGDPEDILESFMNKQRIKRRGSQETLQDESWLRPGSKDY